MNSKASETTLSFPPIDEETSYALIDLQQREYVELVDKQKTSGIEALQNRLRQKFGNIDIELDHFKEQENVIQRYPEQRRPTAFLLRLTYLQDLAFDLKKRLNTGFANDLPAAFRAANDLAFIAANVGEFNQVIAHY